MRRQLTTLFVLAALCAPLPALAQDGQSGRDPIGDMLSGVLAAAAQAAEAVFLKATLYHTGAKGVGPLDSLGCPTVAMRTAAVAANIPRRTLVFIRETVGIRMPDGRSHDGYWYASDRGGEIKGSRIDLFTGDGRESMRQFAKLNLATLTVEPVGKFEGCPKS
jgi:3D (Asp-Asp-Asp) domain-containing protein